MNSANSFLQVNVMERTAQWTILFNLSTPESKFLFNHFSVILYAMVKPNQTPEKSEEEEEGDEEKAASEMESKVLDESSVAPGRCGRFCKPVAEMPLTQRRIV